MSAHDDSGLSLRFAVLAPEPLPGNWDGVLDRAGTARNGRRRLERVRAVPRRRRRLVVVLAALALATAATTAAWAIVREVVLHESFRALPPVGATPSAPESGELVIEYRLDTEDLQDTGGAWGWVYADGRLITVSSAPQAVSASQPAGSDVPEAADLWSSGLLEQRLTPEGVELLRSEIVSTGLFEHHQPAGRMSSPHNVIQVRIDDQLVRVRANFPKRLRERLADPASWLPANAWANRRSRAYVPSRYEIWYGAQPQTLERSSILALLPAAAADLLGAKDAVPIQGDIGTPGFPPQRVTRYRSALTTEEARAVTQALDDAGLGGGLGYSFEIPGTSVDPAPPEKGPVRNVVLIMFLPYLPHGETVCLECG
jgi:hypothetical protein